MRRLKMKKIKDIAKINTRKEKPLETYINKNDGDTMNETIRC